MAISGSTMAERSLHHPRVECLIPAAAARKASSDSPPPHPAPASKQGNRTAHIRHQCSETTVLTCQRCVINTGIEKNEQCLDIDENFYHLMSFSKSKCWDLNNCLDF
jgi:hypothetical protein